MQHIVFDCEIIGSENPVFMVGTKIVETGKTQAFWYHKKGDVDKFAKLLQSKDTVFLGFNSIRFDEPLIAAWLNDRSVQDIKQLATAIIRDRLQPWESYQLAGLGSGTRLDYDHIDLFEVAPGTMTSLKTFAGRMHYPTMIDLPYHYDKDLTPAECKVLETYCLNDLGVTEALFKKLSGEIELRYKMSAQYDIDLRSKSDAQIAEAVLKKAASIGKGKKEAVHAIRFKAHKMIQTSNPLLKKLVARLEKEEFRIDHRTGSPFLPDWLAKETIKLHGGEYQVGLGGLHSKHDKQVCHVATDKWLISDWDVASYYPTIILKCGIVPKLGAGKGDKFITAYEQIYLERLEAKKSGDKTTNNAMKIMLNGTFGKLGSPFCAFYSPELMLAVTLNGQLNLLCLIDELGATPGLTVLSANTDGIMVGWNKAARAKMLKVIADNAKHTGFEYEETQYRKVALKDVNNYLAVSFSGKIKAKGLYAESGLMKNPTAQVCSDAAAAYLKDGTLPENHVPKEKDFSKFLSVRNVSGGAVQHPKTILVDDWVKIAPGEWKRPEWPSVKATVKRKSRPKPAEVGVGGSSIGRVARWFYTKEPMRHIEYVSNGNAVPLSEGAKLCMTLPKTFPKDLDHQRYISFTYGMLEDMGINLL